MPLSKSGKSHVTQKPEIVFRIRKLVDALGFKDQYFKLFLRKRYCINISKFHNQILRPLVFPGVTINFQVAPYAWSRGRLLFGK